MICNSVWDRRPRNRIGTRGATRIPAIGNGRTLTVVRDCVRNDVVFVIIIVVNIESDLIQILLQIGNGAPHDDDSNRIDESEFRRIFELELN